MVFSGVIGAPPPSFALSDPRTVPDNTVVDTTPASREMPFIYVDSSMNYNVFVPASRTNSLGISWGGGLWSRLLLADQRFLHRHAFEHLSSDQPGVSFGTESHPDAGHLHLFGLDQRDQSEHHRTRHWICGPCPTDGDTRDHRRRCGRSFDWRPADRCNHSERSSTVASRHPLRNQPQCKPDPAFRHFHGVEGT